MCRGELQDAVYIDGGSFLYIRLQDYYAAVDTGNFQQWTIIYPDSKLETSFLMPLLVLDDLK